MNPLPHPPTSPPKFRDAAGGEYSLRLNFRLLAQLRDDLAVDFGDLQKIAETWATLLADNHRALQAVHLVARPAPPAFEQFAEAMDGAALEAALEAFALALISFTPPRTRGVVETAIDRINHGMAAAVADAESRIAGAIDAKTAEIRARLGSSAPSVSG
jgi:hypothetical protein